MLPISHIRERDLVMVYRKSSGGLGSAEVAKREDGQYGRIFRVTTRDGGHLQCSMTAEVMRFGRSGRRFVVITKLNQGDTLPRFVDGVRTLTSVMAIEIEDLPNLLPMQQISLLRSGDGFYADGFIVRG